MIPTITGWTREYVDGNLVLFLGGDPAHGFVRYVERLSLAPPRELLETQLVKDPQYEVDEITGWEELVTDEGEHAALVSVRCRHEGETVRRDIGWIFGDAHVSRVSGLTAQPELFGRFRDTVRRLVLLDEQQLGVRRRRYRHAAPAGWRARERGFATMIYEPAQGGAQLEVSPAVPWAGSREDFARQLDAAEGQGGVVVEFRRSRRVTARDGLAGQIWELACRQGNVRFLRHTASLLDDRYAYCVRLDTLDGAGSEEFDALVASVRPVPHPRRRAPEAVIATFAHWC